MLDGPSVVSALKEAGISHVAWLPDSEIGSWEAALLAEPTLRLIRVCREGEAIAVAAGLLLGGKKSVALMQCTGLFEAGDALRNVVHDLKLPLFLVVGVRSYNAYQRRESQDSCPVYTERIVQAWRIPYVLLDRHHSAVDILHTYRQAQSENRAGMVLLAE